MPLLEQSTVTVSPVTPDFQPNAAIRPLALREGLTIAAKPTPQLNVPHLDSKRYAQLMVTLQDYVYGKLPLEELLKPGLILRPARVKLGGTPSTSDTRQWPVHTVGTSIAGGLVMLGVIINEDGAAEQLAIFIKNLLPDGNSAYELTYQVEA